jgi:hypothetical protein
MSHPTRHLLEPPVLVLVAALVVGCGGTAASLAPSPTPEASATAISAPTASPSPADVSAGFLKAITAPDFSAAATFSGTIMIGDNSGTLSGTGTMTGKDSSQTLTIKTSAASQTTSTISIGPTTWSQQQDGPWLEDPKPATPTKDFSDYLADLKSVVDLGIETIDSQKLHHLQPSGGNAVPGEYMGFVSGSGAKDPVFTVDFYATDDGTPAHVVFDGTFTYVSGDTEVAASAIYDLALSEVGTPHLIAPPDDVWVRYHSKARGYTMAHPAGSKITSDKDKDTYQLSGQGRVYVAVTAFKGSTASFASALQVSYRKPFGGDPTSETERTLGGQAAIRLAYQYKNAAGQDSYIVDDVTTRAGVGWEVFLATSGGTEDVAIFNQFAATFTFDK